MFEATLAVGNGAVVNYRLRSGRVQTQLQPDARASCSAAEESDCES
jgi:hypothetical protein